MTAKLPNKNNYSQCICNITHHPVSAVVYFTKQKLKDLNARSCKNKQLLIVIMNVLVLCYCCYYYHYYFYLYCLLAIMIYRRQHLCGVANGEVCTASSIQVCVTIRRKCYLLKIEQPYSTSTMHIYDYHFCIPNAEKHWAGVKEQG